MRIPRSLLLATSLVAAFALSACTSGAAPGASESTEAEPSSEASSLLPPAEGTTQYPLEIETASGAFTIEERPERIVVSKGDVDFIAALGVTPVGMSESSELLPWATEKFVKDPEAVWETAETTELPSEEVLKVDPDLVISSDVNLENASQIGDVAPVIGPAVGAEDNVTPWQERIMLIAEVLDLSAAAQTVIDDSAAEFEKIRADNPEFADLSLSYLIFWGGEWGGAFSSNDGEPNAEFIKSLGFKPSPDAEIFAGSEDISPELIGEMKADVLLLGDYTRGASEEFDAFFSDELLASTPAAQNGRVVRFVEETLSDERLVSGGEEYPFPGHFGWAFSSGPLGQSQLAEVMVPILSKGIGATE